MKSWAIVIVAAAGIASVAVAQRVSDADIATLAQFQRRAWQASNSKPLRVQYQLFDRVASLALPRNFLASYQEQQGREFIAEFAPDGETSENWTRLVTVRALQGFGQGPVTSAAMADRLFNPRVCTIGPLYQASAERPFAPGITVTTVALGCASLPSGAYPAALKGAGEQDFVWLFRDAANFYAVKLSYRGPAWTPGKPPIAPGDAERQLAALGPVQLCAADATDAACKTTVLLEKARKGNR